VEVPSTGVTRVARTKQVAALPPHISLFHASVKYYRDLMHQYCGKTEAGLEFMVRMMQKASVTLDPELMVRSARLARDEKACLRLLRRFPEETEDAKGDCLVLAARSGLADVVKYLVLERKVSIKHKDDYVVRTAGEHGYTALLQFAHEQGAPLTCHRNFALVWALHNKHIEAAAYIRQVTGERRTYEQLNRSQYAPCHGSDDLSTRCRCKGGFNLPCERFKPGFYDLRYVSCRGYVPP
ncbi:Hypothetical protein POVN_LOCUS496, partial [uncultured virus]